MKHFDPTIFVSELSLKRNNLNPEADDVNTLSDEFVKIFNDTLHTHALYRYASRKEQRSFIKPWLTKGMLTSTVLQKIIPSTESSWLQTTQILLENTKLTEIGLPIQKKSPNKIIINMLSQNAIMIRKNTEACQWSNSNKKQIPTK